MSYGTPWRDIHQALRDNGWTYKGIRNGHHHYLCPPGHKGRAFVKLPSSPGRGRGDRNTKAALRREGIDFEGRSS